MAGCKFVLVILLCYLFPRQGTSWQKMHQIKCKLQGQQRCHRMTRSSDSCQSLAPGWQHRNCLRFVDLSVSLALIWFLCIALWFKGAFIFSCWKTCLGSVIWSYSFGCVGMGCKGCFFILIWLSKGLKSKMITDDDVESTWYLIGVPKIIFDFTVPCFKFILSKCYGVDV